MGGTLAGVSRYLKEQNPDIRVVLADPHGSGLYGHVKTGEIKAESSSITEGIGSSLLTAKLEDPARERAVARGPVVLKSRHRIR